MGEDVQSANALERPSANVVLHCVSAVVSLTFPILPAAFFAASAASIETHFGP
jgi:hypothetical protein